MLHKEPQDVGRRVVVRRQVGGQLASQDVGRVESEPAKPQRVEGLDQAGAFVALQELAGLLAELHGSAGQL